MSKKEIRQRQLLVFKMRHKTCSDLIQKNCEKLRVLNTHSAEFNEAWKVYEDNHFDYLVKEKEKEPEDLAKKEHDLNALLVDKIEALTLAANPTPTPQGPTPAQHLPCP